MVALEEMLNKIVSDPSLHGRWLNTLSYLENCGAKMIAGSEHPTMVPKEVLKHASEEFRHAYYLKSQVEKVFPEGLPTYQLAFLLGGHPAKHYMPRLNAKISRYLKYCRGMTGRRFREYGYLLVTYAVEMRARELYPLYQQILKEQGSPVSVSNIIREEEGHLLEITEQLAGTPAEDWQDEVVEIESCLFASFITELKHSMQQSCSH